MKKFWLGFGLLLLILAAGCGVQHKVAKSSSSAASLRSRKSPSSRSSAAIKQTSMLARLKAKSQTTLVYAPFGDSLSVGLFADSKTSRFTTLFADQLHRLTDKTVTEGGIHPNQRGHDQIAALLKKTLEE